MSKVQDKIYPVLGAVVVSSAIFLWPLEIGLPHYDVGINVYLAIIALAVYTPYIVRDFNPFPLMLSGVFILHQLIWMLINGFDFRSILMCTVFIIYFYGIYYSLFFCFKDNFFLLKETILVFLTAQLCLQALQIFGLFSFYNFDTVRQYVFGSIGATGFYGEGSHAALSLVPLMFLKDSRGRHLNVYSILAGLSLFLGISSTAVLGSLLLFVLLILKVNSGRRIALAALVIVGLLTVVVVGGQIFHLAPFSQLAARIWGIFQILGGESGPSVNLSSLVYANGVDMAWSGLKDIFGSGLGHFNIYFADSIARTAIEQIVSGPLNKDDGSVVLLKMIGEMGLFGLAIVVYFVFSSLAIITKYGDCILSVIASFLIMAGIRSAGYFHGPYILSFALVGLLWQMGGLWPQGPFNRQTDLNNAMQFTRA